MNDLKGIIEDCNKSDLVSDKIIKKIIEIIGQEEWQDLHDENNDICTTMGELIITLKGIADLEKENAELKEQISTKDILIKELQEQKVYWKESSFDWRHKFFKLDKVKRLIKKDEQLTKAKEIINEFVKWANWQGNSKCPSFKSIQDKAEQFFSEVEK